MSTKKTTNKQAIFYISTPIYYVNARPHLGHVYSTLYADFLARFQRLQDKKVFFITGCDQHGNKILEAAKKSEMKTEAFVKKNTATFVNLWKKIGISYTHFIETHSVQHETFVKNKFQDFWQKKYLYLDQYEGFYCFNCENFLANDKKNNDNINKICQACQKTPIFLQEENFFLKINQEDRLFLEQALNIWKKSEKIGNNWVKQLINFLKIPKLDFSISRSKITWAIKLSKEHPEQTAYVWFDALWSYISALNSDEQTLVWNNKQSQIVQVLGKEITKFHLLYWPLFLKKSAYKIPDHFLIHGWILNKDQKMSKSIGNVVDPESIIKKYGVDVLRLFVASLIRPNQDVNYRTDLLETFYRDSLVNNLSNYMYRLLIMIQKYQPDFTQINQLKNKFAAKNDLWQEKIQTFIDQYHNHFQKFEVNLALKVIFNLLDFANKAIDQEKPWKIAKEKDDYLIFLLFYWLIIVKVVALFLKPFTIELSNKILKTIELKEKENFNLELDWKKPFYVKKVIKFFE